ncbi:GDAP1 [Mytilus edulis]|uniref:GDAP1 n=1 Tax=Mytilus edulis TaxID=6550 RepID=A0A8S3TGL8_MYTED|nr:GDAP1 [Mytilus edulis]
MTQIGVKKKFTLFYFPTSFSSQKVLLAFYEKEVPFKPKLVSLFSGQHNAPWYVKLNPEGVHVPVLQDEENIITEPDKIIKYIDTAYPAEGPLLVPGGESELGKKVASLQRKLDSIQMDIITYGIIYHPHLSESGCQIPGATQRSMRENFAKRLRVLTHLAAKHPALRDAYLTKSQTAAQKFDIITDAVQVQQHLEDLKVIMEEVETQLKTIKESNNTFEDDLWLFGPMYTAADISLTVLLIRFTLLGMDTLYFPSKTCPYTHNYFKQVQKRSSYVKLQKEISNLRLTLLWENFKMASPYIGSLAGACVIGGVIYWLYNKYK